MPSLSEHAARIEIFGQQQKTNDNHNDNTIGKMLPFAFLTATQMLGGLNKFATNVLWRELLGGQKSQFALGSLFDLC